MKEAIFTGGSPLNKEKDVAKLYLKMSVRGSYVSGLGVNSD